MNDPMTGNPVEKNLDCLFNPRSVAIVGASGDPSKWGFALSKNLLEGGSTAKIYLVNRGGKPILGQPTFRKLTDAGAAHGEEIDLVAICVPAKGFMEAIEEAIEVGARAIVAITAGLGELGSGGALIEARALEWVHSHGAVMVGPNCLGIVDTTTNLQLSSEVLPVGSTAILSQSGNMAIDLANLMREKGLGVSRFVSLGNQADLGVVEFMADCVTHDATKSVALYVEDFGDGREFIKMSRRLIASGKRVLLLAPGSSAAGARAARSHTGSMTTTSQIVDAACRSGGVQRVYSPRQMVDLLVAFNSDIRSSGPRIAIVTDGGGHGAIASDSLTSAGLEVPVLSEKVAEEISRELWINSSVTNPVDLAGAGEKDVLNYARVIERLLASDEIDALLLTGYFGGYSLTDTALAESETAAASEIARLSRAHVKPIIVNTIYPDSPSCSILRDAGIPVYRDIDSASLALYGLSQGARAEFLDPVDLPKRGTPVEDPSYMGARQLFLNAGITFPTSIEVSNEEQLLTILKSGVPPFPIVMKAMGLLHKSDFGGVILNIADPESAVSSYKEVMRRLDPPSVAIEEMVDLDKGVELIVGTVNDLCFGPLVMVGIGGILTEVMGDRVLAIAPVSMDTALSMLLSLRGAPLLIGARGGVSIDLEAACEAVVRLSNVATIHPELSEMEINPLLGVPDGAIGLDARIVLVEP